MNKRIKSGVSDHDDHRHDDALLLAAFADIASFTTQTYPLCPQQSPYHGSTYLQCRPRTVSENSVPVLDNSVTPVPEPVLESKKRPIEIQPKQVGNTRSPPVIYTTILKKKFSWKNYPTLEKFLIANRDEYLRHSTLNYTVQQKQYNNHLTKQMIELAAQCGLVFDDNQFSFVTIRDRIRCYYKSYVQSLKKRGVLLGYAARKAGLVKGVSK